MEPCLGRLSRDSPVFAVELPDVVVIVTRARNPDDAISRAKTLATSFYRSRTASVAEEGFLCRPAAAGESEAYLAAESSWRGDVSLAAVFFEPT